MKRNLSLMIKPSSSKCNLKCKYCFYHSIADARDIKDYGFMPLSTLKEIVLKAAEYCNGVHCSISFQGGESTLVGLEFYKDLIKYIKEITNSTSFSFSIQTNGTLLNNEWGKFLKENKFLVGISLGGNKDIHKNEGTINFLKESNKISAKCNSCKYISICLGGCRRHREKQRDNLNYFCETYYNFYSYSLDKFRHLALIIKNSSFRR